MNPVLARIAPSIIRELNAKKRPTSIDLGLGEPTLRPDPEPLREAMAWVEENGCPYTANAGIPELREAIVRHHRHPGLDDASQVGITVGSQEALYVALKALCDPARDEVLVVTPAYPLYAKLCQMDGVAAREVALDPEADFAPRAAPVLAALSPRTRVVVIASPANPSGRVWPTSELAALGAGLAAHERAHGAPVWIVSDEVYRELWFGDSPPASPADHHLHTIVVSSLSKSCALTGLRLGWFIAPRAVAPALLKVHQFAVSCASTIGQRAALAIFRRPALLAAHRPHYLAQRDALLAALRAHGLSFVEPEGAFYCLVRLTGSHAADSLAAALALLEEKDVVAIPGAAFGAEGFLRLSFVAPPAQLDEGARRIAEFLLG